VLRHGAWTDDFWMGKPLEPLPVPPLGTVAAMAPPPRRSRPAPLVREVRPGDGVAFRAWELRICGTLPYALKLPTEVPSSEAVERDIASAVDDPRLWLVATTVPRANGRAGGRGRIVGFGSGSIEYGFRMQHDAFVNVAVLPEWTGQGIGRALHNRLEAWARGHGARRLTAAVQAPNQAGRRFAGKLGYDEEVAMRGYALIAGRMVDRIRLGKLFFP
jgi:GNAT superfamily N-acetyltransferase